MKLGDFGEVEFLCGGREYVYLTFYERTEKVLSIGMFAYGERPDELVFEPWQFRRQEGAIGLVFGRDWEAFMFELQTLLRQQNYVVEITGLFEMPDGSIIKDKDYATPPTHKAYKAPIPLIRRVETLLPKLVLPACILAWGALIWLIKWYVSTRA